MKTVVSSDMVAHLWAAQSQPSARNANGSLFFRDSTIFSYGEHFPLAKICTTLAGGSVVLINDNTYSRTTSKHQRMVRNAIRHKVSLECDNPLARFRQEHTDNLRQIARECEAQLLLAAKARQRSAEYFSRAEGYAKDHNIYREWFGLDLDAPLTIGEEWKAQALTKIAQQKEDAKHAAEKRRIQAELEQAERLEALEAWKLGNITHHSFYGCPIALRLSSDGTRLETSRGAEVPVPHAKKLWNTIQEIKATGQAYHHNGHTIHVGSFRVDSISAEGDLKAGCHTIPFATMLVFAEKAGW